MIKKHSKTKKEKLRRSSNFVPMSESRLIIENRKRQHNTQLIKQSVFIILDELINNAFFCNFSFKNDTISIESRVHFTKKNSL